MIAYESSVLFIERKPLKERSAPRDFGFKCGRQLRMCSAMQKASLAKLTLFCFPCPEMTWRGERAMVTRILATPSDLFLRSSAVRCTRRTQLFICMAYLANVDYRLTLRNFVFFTQLDLSSKAPASEQLRTIDFGCEIAGTVYFM
jgi:hypothetical protein